SSCQYDCCHAIFTSRHHHHRALHTFPTRRSSDLPQVHSGWIIQVGAYPVETEAKQRLSLAKSKAAKLLAAADAFIESVVKGDARSEEHTSELQSHLNLVCRLLLEKKKHVPHALEQ